MTTTTTNNSTLWVLNFFSVEAAKQFMWEKREMHAQAIQERGISDTHVIDRSSEDFAARNSGKAESAEQEVGNEQETDNSNT